MTEQECGGQIGRQFKAAGAAGDFGCWSDCQQTLGLHSNWTLFPFFSLLTTNSTINNNKFIYYLCFLPLFSPILFWNSEWTYIPSHPFRHLIVLPSLHLVLALSQDNLPTARDFEDNSIRFMQCSWPYLEREKSRKYLVIFYQFHVFHQGRQWCTPFETGDRPRLYRGRRKMSKLSLHGGFSCITD